ncbi:MAG: S8 family serine peptidase, partial [Limisphaerales bacterium]
MQTVLFVLGVAEVEVMAGGEGVLLDLPVVRWVEEGAPPLTTFNDASRLAVGVDVLQLPPFDLTGAGVVLGICDSGNVFLHGDFAGRLEHLESAEVSDHSTHVAGTMAGSGVGSEAAGGVAFQWRGVAPDADIVSWTYTADPVGLHGQLVQRGGILSQNSWGLAIATNYSNCYLLGEYFWTAPDYDRVVGGLYSNTPISVVFAAGNLRWGTTTNTCGYGPYGVLSPPGTAKNVITVGSVDSISSDTSFFSSWGPTKDGRLKPEVVAPGSQNNADFGTTSTTSNGGYGVKQGTSMAAPVVSGGMGLMVQEHRARFGGADPLPSTLKGILIHTAADLNNASSYFNGGPDFASGYGVVQLDRAVEHVASGAFYEGELVHGGTNTFYFLVGDTADEVKLTLAWDDVAAVQNAAVTLVNDLDLVVVDPDGVRHYPWTLDPANPALPARQDAEDHRNVVEQVQVTSGIVPGVWQVQLLGTSVGGSANQSYSLVTSSVLTLESIDGREDPAAGSNHNGFVDPGEEMLLDVVVRNLIAETSEPSLSLLTAVSGGITVLEGESSYGPAGLGVSVTNDIPFRVRVSRDAECGVPLQVLQTTYWQGAVFSNVLDIIPGAYGVTNAASEFVESIDPQLPLAIPDSSGNFVSGARVVSTNVLDLPGQIADVQVFLRINHSFAGDLLLELEHPDGTRVILRPVIGDSGSDYGQNDCGVDVVWTVLDDAASTLLSAGTAPFAGSYRPEQSFTALAGKPAVGEWKLHLADYYELYVGELLCWGLRLETEEYGYSCEVFNRVPVADPQAVEVIYGFTTPVTLRGSDDDADGLLFAVVDQPLHGTISGFDHLAGTFDYLPDPGYSGPDSLTFTVSDGAAESAPATVSFDVLGIMADLVLEWDGTNVISGVGQPLVRQLVVTNLGPNDVGGVEVQVEQPDSFELIGAETALGATNGLSTNLVWLIGELNAGEGGVLNLSYLPQATGLWTNEALAASGASEVNPGDNIQAWVADIRAVTDLDLGLLTSTSPLLLGGTGLVEVAVSNLGTNLATGVAVTGSLPAGLTLLSAVVSDGVVDVVGGELLWDIPELPIEGAAALSLGLEGVATGSWTQEFGMVAYEVDLVQANDTLQVAVDVVPAADLGLEAVFGPELLLGQGMGMEVWVTNRGPSDAESVVLTGTNTMEWAFFEGLADSGDWVTNENGWAWTLASLEVGGVRHLQLSGAAISLGQGTNWIEVSSATADPFATDNALEIQGTVIPSADLSLTLDGPVILIPGQADDYGIAITNLGPSDADAVGVEIVLADGLEMVVGDPLTNLWEIVAPGQLRWTVGSVSSGEGFVAGIRLSGSGLGIYTNLIQVAGGESDPAPGNNAIEQVISVRSDADVQVQIIAVSDPVYFGSVVTQKVDVVNAGPNAATVVGLVASVDAGWNLLSASVSAGDLTADELGYAWNVGSLPALGQESMELVLETRDLGLLTNSVTVSAAEDDLATGNNVAEAVVEVVPAADLEGGVAWESRILEGTRTVQVVVLTNAGPMSATGLVVGTELPAGLAYVGATGSVGSVTESGGVVTWEVGELGVGAGLQLELELDGVGLGVWTNSYSVTMLEWDPTPEDLRAVTAVRLSTDLGVGQSVSTVEVPLGEVLVYSLSVTNLGPNGAEGVVVRDVLPVGVSFVDASGTNGVWVYESGVLSWEVGSLGLDEVVSLDVQCVAGDVGLWTNLVSVLGEEIDLVEENDVAESVVEVVAAADLGVGMSGGSPLLLGQRGLLQVAVTNAGPSEATGVVVGGVVSTNLLWVEGLVSTGAVSLVEGVWEWQVGEMGAGEVATLEVSVEAVGLGLGTNTVSVGGVEVDVAGGDNVAEAVVEVVPAADLEGG